MTGTAESTRTDTDSVRLRKPRWTHIGPGIVVAATGVGAGDLVATLIAGSKFGYTLLWAAVIGCLVKISLAEATGRWHLATGRTIFEGWRSLGRWTGVYFAVYVVIWGFVYGATAMSSSALPLAALFPDGPGIKTWAVITGLTGLVFVWFNQYAVFERVMTVLVGVMFVVVVYVAVRVTPDLGAAFAGLTPVLPDGSLLYTLGLIGGVGGTITMAAYGYWVNAKGWTDASWMRMMRLDNRVAYLTTGVFVLSMLIVGAELLHSSHIALTSGDKGLVDLGGILEDRFGAATAKLFLVGFFATAFTSVIGVWHGVSLMFADFVDRIRQDRRTTAASATQSPATETHLAEVPVPRTPATEAVPSETETVPAEAVPSETETEAFRTLACQAGTSEGHAAEVRADDTYATGTSELQRPAAGPLPANAPAVDASAADASKAGAAADASAAVAKVAEGGHGRSTAFRLYLLWLTVPPMSLLWLNKPFGLVIVYGVLGAFFMPFLALTLIWMLNSSRTPGEWRNGVLSNVMLSAGGLLFVVLCVQQVRELPW